MVGSSRRDHKLRLPTPRLSAILHFQYNPLSVVRFNSELALKLERLSKGVLIDLRERDPLTQLAANWSDRVKTVRGQCYERPGRLEAMLIRPDGYTAWIATSDDTDQECERGVTRALNRWFGEAMDNRKTQSSTGLSSGRPAKNGDDGEHSLASD